MPVNIVDPNDYETQIVSARASKEGLIELIPKDETQLISHMLNDDSKSTNSYKQMD